MAEAHRDSPPPEPARFDPARRVWVLSRYADVSAALREPRLLMVGAREESQPDAAPESAQAGARAEMQAALSTSRISEWQRCLGPLADQILGQTPRDRPVDLVAEFATPW